MENNRLRSEDAYIVRMKLNLIESENCFGQVTENLAEAKQQIKQKDEELAEAGRKIQQKEDDLARIKELFLRQEQLLEETKQRLAEEMKISQKGMKGAWLSWQRSANGILPKNGRSW